MLRSLHSQAPELKSHREIGLMREAGKVVAEALRLCREKAKVGARTIEIDSAVERTTSGTGPCRFSKVIPGRSPNSPFPRSPASQSMSRSCTASPGNAKSVTAIW